MNVKLLIMVIIFFALTFLALKYGINRDLKEIPEDKLITWDLPEVEIIGNEIRKTEK